MDAKERSIPQLRFPGFKGEWEDSKLGLISTMFSGGTPLTTNKAFYNGNIPLIKSGEINSAKTEQFISEEALKQSSAKIVKEGDLLYAIYGATSGEVAVSRINGAINQAVLCIRAQLDTYYLYLYLCLKKNFIIKKYLQGGQGNLSADIVKSITVNYPTLPEQKKIADFLSAVASRIDLLKQKEELLNRYKKGVMQKIFNREIRFKADDGSEFPEWEEKKFGDVYSFRSTYSLSRDNLNYTEGDIKNIHYGDIHTKFKTLFDVSKEDVPFLNGRLINQRFSEDSFCRVGDLIFADASEDLTDVGKCIELVKVNNEKVVAGLHTILARPNLQIMGIGFGGYLMKTVNVRIQIMREAQGSKVSSISPTRLSKIKLNIPTLPEQTKIGNFLSAIDNKIQHTQKQIDQVEHWEKGLMQKMFV